MRLFRAPNPSLCLFLAALFLALCHAVSLEPRATVIPAPIAFAPDQNWDGIDGSWSTFTLRIGTPQQFVRTYLSTASQQTWAVLPFGCNYAAAFDTCANRRGWIFNNTLSSTWDPVGNYSLWIERNLGYTGGGIYAYETVGLGGQGEGGPTLKNTTVGGIGTNDFYLGIFGVNPKPTNFSDFNNPSPSYMTMLKEQKLIPSLSFGYTAGAPYRFTSVGVHASLTLGGFDQSRLIPNDVSFGFAPDNERDIVASVERITVTDGSQKNGSLFNTPIFSYIDSTVPHIWLPLDACQAFEKAFGLIYDKATDLYLVDDALHDALVARNANVTFTLGNGKPGHSTVDIVLPYASFDLTAQPPYRGLKNSTRYFPLRRAANDTQYTLGRTFLQEAFLTVDWERQNFSISQVRWDYGAQQRIIPIQPLAAASNATNGTSGQTHTTKSSSSSMGAGAIAGIVVGAIAAVAAVALFLFTRHRRKRDEADRKASASSGELPNPSRPPSEQATIVYPKAELDATQIAKRAKNKEKEGQIRPDSITPGTPLTPYSPSSTGLAESDSKPREIYEMPGDMPSRQEAGGRELSEKQAMVVRERRYNGIDPVPSPTTSATPPNCARRAPISPSDVVEVDRSAAPVSPLMGSENGLFSPLDVTPDTPRQRFSFEEFD